MVWAYISWKHLHGTHTHRCADQSEVHSHDDRSRDMSQECWGRSESRVALSHLQALVQNIHLCLIMRSHYVSVSWRSSKRKKCKKQRWRSYLLHGTGQRSPDSGGPPGCCCLIERWGWDCFLETRWARCLGDAHQQNSHCHKISRGPYLCRKPKGSKNKILHENKAKSRRWKFMFSSWVLHLNV